MGAEADFKPLVEFSPNADRFFHLAKIDNASDRIVEDKEVLEKAIEFGLGEDSLHPLD
jgi:hypothetical protein